MWKVLFAGVWLLNSQGLNRVANNNSDIAFLLLLIALSDHIVQATLTQQTHQEQCGLQYFAQEHFTMWIETLTQWLVDNEKQQQTLFINAAANGSCVQFESPHWVCMESLHYTVRPGLPCSGVAVREWLLCCQLCSGSQPLTANLTSVLVVRPH